MGTSLVKSRQYSTVRSLEIVSDLPNFSPAADGARSSGDPHQLLGWLAAEARQAVLPAAEIEGRQRRIFEEVLQLSRSMRSANFTRIDSEDLRRMVMLYDREYFAGRLIAAIGRQRVRFGLSSRMTSVAGKLVTHYPKRGARRIGPLPGHLPGPNPSAAPADHRRFEMVLSSTLLFQAFADVDRPITVTGLRCANRLEAMQRVCEHELIHLVEMFLWNDSCCSQGRFQGIVSRLFGHTDYRHDLITPRERAAQKFDIRVGTAVRFRFQNQWLTGRVNRITRRATVLVEAPHGEPFTDGRRYIRYYVPLEQLQRVS